MFSNCGEIELSIFSISLIFLDSPAFNDIIDGRLEIININVIMRIPTAVPFPFLFFINLLLFLFIFSTSLNINNW